MLRGRKLLLADDSLAIQKVIELTFEDEGMQVLSVGSGRQAVERLEEVRPDIVLADVFMPEPNGYQVCEHIKRDERFRHIPVILLVGSFEPFNEAEARRVGADDYLTKPFQSIRQMVSKVGSLLSGNKSEEAATQELPAPPEPPKRETQARMDDLELATADTAPLYMRREAQSESDAPSKGNFADLQLDDEMIEARAAIEFGPAGQTRGESQQQRPTEPFSTRDLAEVGLASAGTGQPITSGGSNVLAEKTHETAGVLESSSTPTRNAERTAAGDDALLDLDDVEMPRSSAMAEADDFILDLQDAAETRAQTAPSAEAFSSSFESAPPIAEVEPAIESELTEAMTESAPQAAEFAEAQVMGEEQRAEFAPIEEEQSTSEFHFYQPGAADSSQEQATDELPTSSQLAPTERLPGMFRPDEETPAPEAESAPEAALTSEAQPSEQGQIGLAQLSPEVIETIARRVVEQLSTKVVEQIAWEVVPPLAELLIKRRLEEEGKQ
ncbi:MAG TPA: response regulator [Pyrinomonadaceae bacterium]